MAAASAIVVIIVEIDAVSIAVEGGGWADARPPFAEHVLRTGVAAFPTIVGARVEPGALFFPAPAAAADLAVLLLATIVPARAGTDAVAVRIFLEAVGADALVHGVTLGINRRR